MNPTPSRVRRSCPILAAVSLTAVLTTACARGPQSAAFTPTESSLYITSEGTITSATIETYTNDYYTEEELKSSVEEALAAFNASQPSSGNNAATINTCTLSNGTATLLIDFRDPSAYLAFMAEYPDEESEIQIKSIQITDAASCSYAETSFKSPDGKKENSAGELKTQTKLYTAAVEGPAFIQTDGAIQYISDGVTLVGENQVRTPADGVSYIVFK